jgi:dihydroflavonol-4-reductase
MKATVLVTGLSGFIAKHVALVLLAKGYSVRGTVRNLSTSEMLREALKGAAADISRLELVEADLEEDEGWADAVGGTNFVLHLASPFPLQQPKGRLDLVPAAREGTLRVLKAVKTAGKDVERVVVTSSMVAMMYRAHRTREFAVRENDWTDTDWPPASPYIVSKTLAERAAWQWSKENGFESRMVVVNPGFVLGPALDTKAATSLDVIKLIFSGAHPAVPPVHFPVVDVRDLAELHVAALTTEAAGGRRLMGCADTLSMSDIAAILKEEFPEKGGKIPTKTLPAFMVRFLSVFDRSLKTVLADMNVVPRAENGYVTELTGVRFRSAREAVIGAGRSLIELGVV